MNTLTRSEGYKLNAWKGKVGEDIFEDFVKSIGKKYTKIEDKIGNMTKGDYIIGNKYYEVKSQNIGQYRQNFIELGEVTDKEYHSNGYKELTEYLSRKNLKLQDYLEPIEYFNFALKPVSNGATMVYINRNTKLIYLYSPNYFLTTLTENIKLKGINRALGKSNKDSIGAFAENAKASYQKIDNKWVYTGTADEQAILKYITN